MYRSVALLFLVSVVVAQNQVSIWNCGFETDANCGMTIGQYTQTFSDTVTPDFLRAQASTPSGQNGLTGPTDAQEGDWYIHFEASFRPADARTGVITSPTITYNSNLQNLRFTLYFYDHGSSLGDLTLRIIRADGQTNDVLINDGQNPSKAWNFTSIPLNNPGQNFRFQIRATTEGRFDADWAIDNINIVGEEAGCDSNPCVALASCTDISASPFFICTCPIGYAGDGRIGGTGCSDVNECLNNPCGGLNVRCVNTVGSYVCQCLSGYQFNSGSQNTLSCTDTNECLASPCTGAFVNCNNSPGSYSCDCFSGYQPNFGTGDSLSCADINECADANYCTGSNTQCVNSPGSASCQCNAGYVPLNNVGTRQLNCQLQLVDECLNNPCGANSFCTDTQSSYFCTCNTNYAARPGTGPGSSLICDDVNECNDVDFCVGANTVCVNNIGAPAACQCASGYRLDNRVTTETGFQLTCVLGPVNECLNNPCPANSFCTDTASSFFCSCNSGYQPRANTGNGVSLVCDDVNECLSVTCDPDADCINIPGSYRCDCRSGFTQAGTQQAAECYRNGGLSNWVNFGGCSELCGGGLQIQQRSCSNPSPEAGGLPCDPEVAFQRQIPCNTQNCSGCEIPKPCSCSSVTQYVTGSEPTQSLALFPGISPGDLQTSLTFLHIWQNKNVEEFCEDAKCNSNVLSGAIANMTIYIDQIVNIYDHNNDALDTMKDVINCNENVEIEGNLWSVYDHLCDRGVAIGNIKRDLMQKRTMLEDESERCSKRSWFTNMLEGFNKGW